MVMARNLHWERVCCSAVRVAITLHQVSPRVFMVFLWSAVARYRCLCILAAMEPTVAKKIQGNPKRYRATALQGIVRHGRRHRYATKTNSFRHRLNRRTATIVRHKKASTRLAGSGTGVSRNARRWPPISPMPVTWPASLMALPVESSQPDCGSISEFRFTIPFWGVYKKAYKSMSPFPVDEPVT